VQPKHIKESFRLLSKSIIRVEQPDIHLEEDDDLQQVAGDEEMDVEPSAGKTAKTADKWEHFYVVSRFTFSVEFIVYLV